MIFWVCLVFVSDSEIEGFLRVLCLILVNVFQVLKEALKNRNLGKLVEVQVLRLRS